MTDQSLLCDGCARESWPDGALVLHVEHESAVKIVRGVRVSCGPTCNGEVVSGDHATVVFRFAAIADVLDYADAIIPQHDWERGTVQRLSRVLTVLHQKRST